MSSLNPFEAPARRTTLWNTLRKHRFEFTFLVPLLLFLLLIIWLPFLRGVWMSLHDWPIQGDVTWVGLQNYVDILQSDVFYASIRATAIFVLTTVIQLGIALLAALLVTNQDHLNNLVGSLFMIPYTMPPVVTGSIWVFLLNPSFGPVFQYAVGIGLLEEPIYWSTNGDLALIVITLVTAWTFWPFMFLVIYASLQNVPVEYYETAQMYGANRLQTFFNVTLPQIKTAIYVAVAIRIVWNLAKVSQPLQMTGGGPGNSTSILAVLLYRYGYTNGTLGRAYVVGIILLIVTLVLVLPFIRAFEKHRGSQQ